MLERTDHPKAPWHVVAGDDKRIARVSVVETVCRTVEETLVALGYDVSGPDPLPEDRDAD